MREDQITPKITKKFVKENDFDGFITYLQQFNMKAYAALTPEKYILSSSALSARFAYALTLKYCGTW